mgnify:FL=1
MMSARTPAPRPDPLASSVEWTLGQARLVGTIIYDLVLPNLPPIKRGAAEHLLRRISRSRIFDETMLNDLGALIALVERESEAGTHRGWQADAHHIRSGWPVIQRDARAEALASSATALRDLRMGIEAVLDVVEAARVRDRLLAQD